MNGIIVWAWDALVPHGCFGHRNGGSGSISRRAQGVKVLETLRGQLHV